MQPNTDRLHALDAVRAFALLAGIVIHASIPWLEGLLGGTGETPSTAAAAIFYFVHIFRMPVFFLIAGYFGHLVTERRGARMFTKDRAKRIALPLVIGLALIPPLSVLAFALGSLASGMSIADLTALEQSMREEQSASAHFGPPVFSILGHLWFLYYLLLFYIGALIARATARALDRDGRAMGGIDRVLRFLMRTGLAVIVFALPVAAWYVFLWPEWPGWTGLPAPASIVPSVPALLAYGLFFAVGWLLHRQTDVLLQLRERWVQYSLVAIVLAVGCYLIAGATPQWSAYLHGWELRIYATAYMMATWCLSFALIGLALRFLSKTSPVRRYVADSSYWLYLMHVVPIAFFVALLHPLTWHWSAKFAITIAASVPLLLLSYHAFVRFTFIGATINGRRHPRTGAAEGARSLGRVRDLAREPRSRSGARGSA